MTQQELDIFCVNTQSMIGMQSWELIQYLKNHDPSAEAYAARLVALHGLMRSVKDMVIDDEILSDETINDVQSKVNYLLFEDKNVWDNSMPIRFGF